MSETQVYNYFGSREKLCVDIARREFARIEQARLAEARQGNDHYSQIMLATRTYLRQIGERGGLLYTLLSSPEVRGTLIKERRPQQAAGAHSHAARLVKLYGVAPELALACTIVLTRLCVRAGKLIADKKIGLDAAESLCLSIVLRGSRTLMLGRGQRLGGAQSLEAA
jgi:AcrR family transcriptional regulator